MAVLRINKLERVGKQRLQDGPVSIGRSMKNDMCLPHASVSRHHCVIEIEDGVSKLRDLDSRHGTTVNGKDITETVLHDGDVIGLGIFELVFYDENAPADDTGHDIDLEIFPDDSFGGDSVLAGTGTGEHATPSAPDRSGDLNELRETVTALKLALEARQTELTDAQGKLDASRADAETSSQAQQQATEQLQCELDTARADAETQRQRADELEAKLTRQTEEALAQLTTFETQRADYDERLKQHETEEAALRKQRDKAAKDLKAKSDRLEDALSKITGLKEAMKTLKAQIGSFNHNAQDVDQFITYLRASAQQVLQVLKQLGTVKQNAQTLEQAYVQANQWVEDAEAYESESYDDMVRQCEAVGEQLQTAHAQLDSTVIELQQVVTQLCQYVLSEPVRATVDGSAKRSFLSRLVKQ